MATQLNLYDKFRRKQISGAGGVDLTTLTVKVMLVTSSYMPNQNADEFRADVISHEVSGAGYTAGGNTLANPVVNMDASGNISIDFDDPDPWLQNAGGFTNARRAIFYVARGGAPAADELIGYTNDFGADVGNVAGDFAIHLDAAGLIVSTR